MTQQSDSNPSPDAVADRPLAPYSQEAEEAVIGSVLMDPPKLATIRAFLKADDFFLLRHNYIWQALIRLADRGDAIDPLTVSEELSALGYLSDIGGPAYLLNVINKTPTSVNAEIYGRLVARTASRRQMLLVADKIRDLALDESINIGTAHADMLAAAMTVSSPQTGTVVPIMQAASSYYDTVQQMLLSGKSAGFPTGFVDLDKLLGGLHPGKYITIAGRPAMGKSAFATNLLAHVAEQGGTGLLFSMEMTTDELMRRLISANAGINTASLRDGHLSDGERERFVEAIGRLADLSIFLDATFSMTPALIRDRAHRVKYESGLDVVIIDYMQLMAADGHFNNNRVAEIEQISRACKALAQELNIPVIGLAQLNRELEKRKDKRPQLSDLRNSGSIEQDSDIVIFLYRDEVYDEDTLEPGIAEVIVAKNRDGKIGKVKLGFEGQYTRFRNLRTIDLAHL